MFRVLAAILIISISGLSVAASPQLRFEVNEPFAPFKGTSQEQNEAVDSILKNSTSTNSIFLFIAANTAYRVGRVEDSAFLFYAALMRAGYDFSTFEPVSKGGGSGPGVYLSFLRSNAEETIKSAIMKQPKGFSNVVRRLESWKPEIPANYDPGWEFKKKNIDPTRLSKMDNFVSGMRGFAILLNTPEYYDAYQFAQQYYFSPPKERAKPDLKEKNEKAEATMRALEEKLQIEGLYFKKNAGNK